MSTSMTRWNSTLRPVVSRRAALKLGTAGLAACAFPSLAAGKAPSTKLTGLLHNEDCTNFFYFQDFPAGKAGAIVDRYVDVLADAGVSVLMCNINARRTNYRGKVWDAFWDGYDPHGADE